MSAEVLKSGVKTFATKIWYFVIGALITGLTVECVNLRMENVEARRMVAETLTVVERTQSTSSECLMTLSNLKGRIGLATEGIKPQEPQKQTNPVRAPSSMANLFGQTTSR